VGVHRRGDGAVLEVVDTGVGLSPELLSRVFDVFVQGDHSLDRSSGGLGIGLTLVRRLAELHGGRATAASDGPGRGACFTVSLPAIAAPLRASATVATAARPSAAVAAPARAARRERVLIVEDNADTREALQEALALDGYEVFASADGRTALDVARREQPGVVVVDIGLPGLDGYEVAQRLRASANGDRLLLIGLSGYGQPEARRRATEAGFDAYLTKPVAPDELARVIEAGASGRDPADRRSVSEA